VDAQIYPKDANRKSSTYGDGHKLVKVQNRLIDRVAARPRLEAFMEYLSSNVVRRRGSDAHDTYRSTRVVDTNLLCIICNIELFSTALTRTARHYLIFYLSESYSIAKMGKNRRPMSWAITREKGELNYRDRAVRIHRLEPVLSHMDA
jgi:hypothetical protein